MSFNGTGVFERLYSWVADAANGIFIRADRMDAEMDGFATGLSQCLTRDGQAPMTANLKMGGFAITGLKDPEADQEAATRKFVNDKIQAVAKPTISDTAPANPVAGDQWFKTSAPTGLFIWVVGSVTAGWQSAAGLSFVPVGAIMMWSGTLAAIPTGWALCDGNNSTPDLRSRFIVGAGSDYAVNDVGGAKDVTLTEAQMPAHDHSVNLNTNSAGDHTHNLQVRATGSTGITVVEFTAAATQQAVAGRVTNAGAHTHNVNGNTSSKGVGAAHENRPPYFALAYIMKT